MHEWLDRAAFFDTYVIPFGVVESCYDPEVGFIAWRRGTGGNVELLHLRSFSAGCGYGRQLVYAMLEQLRKEPPYYSVFGFTRVGNDEAQRFYGALGFNLQTVCGLYAEGEAVLFWQDYQELLRRKEECEDHLRSQA